MKRISLIKIVGVALFAAWLIGAVYYHLAADCKIRCLMQWRTGAVMAVLPFLPVVVTRQGRLLSRRLLLLLSVSVFLIYQHIKF